MKWIRWGLFGLLGLALMACGAEPDGGVTAVATATATPRIGVTLTTRTPPTVAVRQTTPTPLPTATATPTATPIVVQIVAGDTLLALAIAHNTTTEEIVALNPGIQPNLLQIGQPVILPPPATPLAQLVGGTAVPLQMAVQQVHIYPTPVGSAWVVGELLNEGSQAVEGVLVTIDVQNGAGVVVATVMAWAALPIVQPEQRTPFAVLIAELPAEELFPVVTVSGGQSVVDLGSRYLDVAVSETAVQSEGDVATVQATVTNVGTEAAWVMVVAALYDAQGQIAGYTQVALPTPLAVGEKQQVRWQTAVPGALGETAVLTPFGQRLIAP